MRRGLLVTLGPFMPQFPNTFPLLWKGADGRSLLWHGRPSPLRRVLDGAWDLGRQGMGTPKSPRLHLREMPGSEQALRAGMVQTRCAQPRCSLSHPMYQRELQSGNNRITMLKARER